MKRVYLLLSVLGLCLPNFFSSILHELGLVTGLFLEQLFSTRISSFFVVDLIITAMAFSIFAYNDSKKNGKKNLRFFPLTTRLISPSLSIPSCWSWNSGSPIPWPQITPTRPIR
jgi:hypothetical protein